MGEILGSLDRALDIILLIYAEKSEQGITDISRKLNLNKSTVHRTLATLQAKGFLIQNEETEKYWLGMRLYAIGMLAWNQMALKDLVRPYARQLFEELGEDVNVCILEQDTEENPCCIIIHKEYASNQKLTVYQAEGSSSECYCSAVGKCLMAFDSRLNLEQCRDDLLIPYTEHTLRSWADIRMELDIVREQGYAIEDQERELGLVCIGAPIMGTDGNVVAAISISGPASRIQDQDIAFRIARVKQMGIKISQYINR